MNKLSNEKQLDAWRNRAVVVTVKEHCEHCKTLQPEVKHRKYQRYTYSKGISMTSCELCFDKARATDVGSTDSNSDWVYT
jgi:hypothetical protein